jgi:hypothetical protein
MKKILLIFFFFLLFISCEKENNDILIGKWKLVKGYSIMGGGYIPDVQDQRMEEYTKDNIRIRYDFEGKEIGRCNYSATNSTVTISGKELNGDTWSSDYNYWFMHDTLKIKNDGGFEYYDEFFIRVK